MYSLDKKDRQGLENLPGRHRGIFSCCFSSAFFAGLKLSDEYNLLLSLVSLSGESPKEILPFFNDLKFREEWGWGLGIKFKGCQKLRIQDRKYFNKYF